MAVFPPGGDAAKNPDYVCCAENGLGLRELLKDKDFDVFVTSDKEGPDCGTSTELAVSSVKQPPWCAAVRRCFDLQSPAGE